MGARSLADELLCSMLPPELLALPAAVHGESAFHRGLTIACEQGCLVGTIMDEGDAEFAPMIELAPAQVYVGYNATGQLCVPMGLLDVQQLVDAALLSRRGRPLHWFEPAKRQLGARGRTEIYHQPLFAGRCRCCGGRFFEPVFQRNRVALRLHTTSGWRG